MNCQSLRFTALFLAFGMLASTVAFAADSTWVGGSTGVWTDAANWSAGVPQTSNDTATINAAAVISLPSSVTVKTLTINAPATFTVASGATLAFSNGGGDVLVANATCLIDGAGDLTFSMNGTTGTDYANIKPASGVTLTLSARIAASGNSGLDLNSAGTLLLTNPDNSFAGLARISTANGTLAFSAPAALGLSGLGLDGSPSRIVYTGAAAATLSIPVQITAASAVIENAGSGPLTLGGSIAPASSGTKTLTFVSSTQTNIVSGGLSNGSGLLSVVSGSGTLVLNGTVTDSTLTANGGSTLGVGSSAVFQNRVLTLSAGSTLALNPSAADGFAVTLPLTNTLGGAGVRFVVPAAATASTVTVPNLIRSANATLDLSAQGLGSARNTLLISNFTPGSLPAWLTVNGQPAAYDASLGVVPVAASATNSLTALGPSVIPDDATAAAVIDAAGTSGGITLAADPTRVFSLTQAHADNPATVDLGGQILAASVVAVADAGNGLTLTNGTLSAPSAQTAPSGTATFPTLATPPIVWFDLSDGATVTTNAAGRISLLANKGSLGTALDAAVPSDRTGPRYVPVAVNGLGVARADGIEPPQGLATLGNSGITGSVARTVFLVASRSPVSQNNFYAFYMGPDGSANQDFCICERADRTSFSTKSTDLDVTPASPVGHNVLTFISGLSGTPNAGAGYRNGILLGSKTFAFATVDAPVRILHRPITSANFSGPGEVAEALVFNYTLSDTDRAAVEAYLMRKWGIAAQRDDVLLALRNDSPTASLAVSADLTEAYGTRLAFAKSGPGNAVLGGPVAFSGSLLIGEGSLTFGTPADHTTVIAGPVSGPGTLVKTGAGSLALSLSSPYAGGTVVQGGTLCPGANGSLGTGPVAVESGAALDIANGSATANPITGTASFANSVSVTGSGPDGLGALRHSGGVNQMNAFKSVALAGDTAVWSASRFDVRGGAFDFGGHALTVNGGEFSIVASAVSNVTAASAVHVANGMMRFEQSDFGGSSVNVADAASGAGVCLYQMTAPMLWSLRLADNAYFRANNGLMATNLNRWAGPVTLASGTARLNTLTDGTAAITGPIGGDGGLLKEGPGWFWLFNPANAYAGATTVTQGNLYAVSPGSLGAQAAAGLTVSGSGALIARAASGTSADGWSSAALFSLANGAAFTTPATSLGIDTFYEAFDYSGTFPYIGLKKLGPYTLTLSGFAPDLGPVEIYNGVLDLTATGSHDLHAYSATVGAASDAAQLGVLRLVGTTLDTDDPGFSRAGPTLTVGSAANARGILYVGTGSAANGCLLVGNSAGAAGAVYQTAGVITNTGGNANEAAIGVSGYGYYRLDGGELANKGTTQLGRNSSSTGILDQRGGSVLINAGLVPATGVVGDYYNGTFSTRAGVGIFQLSGGTFTTSGHTLQLGEWSAENTYSNGLAVFTVESNALAVVDAEIRLANRNGSPEAYVNLNGGTLSATFFQNGGNNAAGNTAKAAIGFNGGLLRVPSQGTAVSALVRTGANNTPTLLNVYAGGAVIEILGTDGGVSLDQPLRAPANFGVASVSVTSAGAGYIAPPAVTFSGSGTGATAVAEINFDTGALTAIRVTSPGVGYASAPTVTLRGGGCTTTAAATASIGTTASGGLTKLGPGTLNLTVPATYTGPTVVSNGTLRLAAEAQSLSAASTLTLAGGTLDLAGTTLTNNNAVVLAGGRLVNGTVSALSFVKSGSGTATLSAVPACASAAALHNSYVRSLNPLVWYDPSDAATVTLDATGRITALLNKGSKSGMDATSGYVYIGTTALGAPLLATGALSYAASGLPMIKIDGNDRGLASGANLGITGAVYRTVVSVLTRESTTGSALVCFGASATAQMFEVGDRMDSSKVVVGGYGGYDLTMSPVNPAQQVNVVFGCLTGPKVSEAWRTGVSPNHVAFTAPGNFNTADSRLHIGQRAGSSKGAEARGEIGETLVFDRVLTEGERTELQRLLTLKWMTAQATDSATSSIPVTVAAGTLRLVPGADAIAALAPAVWYDPSDAASVTTNAAGRVTAIVNKGSRSSAMNATVRSGYQGALLVSGTNTYSAAGKPMLKIDSNTTGLQSASNTGISGTAPRTLIAVLSRDATAGDQLAVVSFGDQSVTRSIFELSDRYGGNCFGNNGDDLYISPILAATNANVYMMDTTATNVVTGWRTGGFPAKVSKTLGGNWATVDTPFCLGYRSNTHRDTFRGQIGETLLFNRLLTETERADVEDYLVNKWTRRGADDPFSGATFDVAAGATLDLGGARTNVTVTGSGTITNGTLGAGFVISPAGDNAVGELTLAGVTLGTGTQYRVTISGSTSDRLLVDGSLSALTVVPATDAAITGHAYVIATGSTTGKPTLSGFPNKFKLQRQGNDLLLTSIGGTTLLLK